VQFYRRPEAPHVTTAAISRQPEDLDEPVDIPVA